MTPFEQFIITYFVSVTALAGVAVVWRNWLEDHPRLVEFFEKHLRGFSKIFTCGSCFTFWITLAFVLWSNPIPSVSYFIQWMSLGWAAVFLRFVYVALQEAVGFLVHRFRDHPR